MDSLNDDGEFFFIYFLYLCFAWRLEYKSVGFYEKNLPVSFNLHLLNHSRWVCALTLIYSEFKVF